MKELGKGRMVGGAGKVKDGRRSCERKDDWRNWEKEEFWEELRKGRMVGGAGKGKDGRRSCERKDDWRSWEKKG